MNIFNILINLLLLCIFTGFRIIVKNIKLKNKKGAILKYSPVIIPKINPNVIIKIGLLINFFSYSAPLIFN